MAGGQVVPWSSPRGEQVPRSQTVLDSCVAIASRISFGAGPSRDGRRYSARPDLEADSFQIKDPGTSTRADETSVRRGTRRSPMLAHETLPVSGASVMGMTYGAHHGPGSMPAGVPGIPAASAQRDRLHSKGQLLQRPADDSAEEDWSRAMQTKLPNGYLAKSGMAPTRPSGAQNRSDECHDHVQPMRDRNPFPQWDPRQRGADMPSRCRTRGKTLYKVSLPEQGQRITPRTPPPWSRQPVKSSP
jgi:hypothetical protein